MRNLLVLIFLLLLFGGFFIACSVKDSQDTLNKEKTSKSHEKQFTLIKPEYSAIDFSNPVIENDSFNTIDFIYVYNGGGVSIGDFNNDGLPDIYFTGNMVSSRLYLNKGQFRFEDVTVKSNVSTSGWATGSTIVDINHDGLLDIYVCRSGNYTPEQRANLLFINQGLKDGMPIFKEAASEYGLNDPGFSTQAAFFDYDKDGDLDMYLLNHTNEERQPNRVKELEFDGKGLAADRFYRNDGIAGFKEVSYSIGIRHDGWGLGLAINDLNGDGWEDILVTNDFIADDFLYINAQDGTFSEQGKQYLNHFSHFSMGNDVADYNNDGLVDIFVNDMLPADNFSRQIMAGPLNYEKSRVLEQFGYHKKVMRNTLQLNNGPKADGAASFSEIGQLAGIDATDWSWGPLVADLDNDGFKDIYITTGMKRLVTNMDYIMDNSLATQDMSLEESDNYIKNKTLELPASNTTNFAFRNNGNLRFSNVTPQWGLRRSSLSNGSAFSDLDLDGDLDIVVNNIDASAFVFKNNNVQENNYVQIILRGSSQNQLGLGAKVWVFHSGTAQHHHHSVVRGFQSSVDPVVHFGLGKSNHIDSILIKWPDGRVNKRDSVNGNCRLIIDYRKSQPPDLISKSEHPKILANITSRIVGNVVHRDQEFADFQYQPLIPATQSEYGPKLSVGEVNGDSQFDFYVGGTYEVSGRLFIQNQNGEFRPVDLDKVESVEEDGGSAFFDADGDGDMDLYVCSGGGEFQPDSPYYQDRLYLNNGKGGFEKSLNRLPVMYTSSSCVEPFDFDQDGDMDLFIGGRLTPLQYPLPGTSYLLRNDNGRFKNVTALIAPQLSEIGMVTDAVWSDYDSDGDSDLIVVGEFMPMVIFENIKGNFQKIPEIADLHSGWINCIDTGDFDSDGDPDYILGNLGLNSRYRPDLGNPVSVYAADFDNNGRLDPILTYYIAGMEVPVHPLGQLAAQLPVARQVFPDYKAYAGISFKEMFPIETINAAYTRRMTGSASVYLENLGGGKFRNYNLPIQAQFAPIQGMVSTDVNGDGKLDILAVGNFIGADPVSGPYDASIGLLLLGHGNGTFDYVPHSDSGFFENLDCRDLVTLKGTDGKHMFLVSRNKGKLALYRSF